jgi:hypothetical protein
MKSENENESEINLENNFPDFDEEKSKSQNWFWNVSSDSSPHFKHNIGFTNFSELYLLLFFAILGQ